MADVERCNLYLFDTGAAVLALEIDFGLAPTVVDLDQDGNPGSTCRMTLADVQTFVDHARRAYTPFFWSAEAPAKVPVSVCWLDKGGKAIEFEASAMQAWREVVAAA